MKKIASLFFLLTVVIFMTITFTTLQYQINANETDKFGYPFVFFSSANNAEVVNIVNFSGIALVTDLGISALGALFLIYVILLIKPVKKNKIALT
ncbi:MAG: hypothetical protein ACOVO1_02040 [Chitinophagaceae bacterium]